MDRFYARGDRQIEPPGFSPKPEGGPFLLSGSLAQLHVRAGASGAANCFTTGGTEKNDAPAP
jgi:hypothetical protein